MKHLLASILISASMVPFAAHAVGTPNDAKTAYKQTKDTAAAEYKAAKAKCDALKDNDKDVCIQEAKAARIHAVAEAEAQYKNTPKARASARKDIADAD